MKIENISVVKPQKGRKLKYPFDKLEINQSFFSGNSKLVNGKFLAWKYSKILGKRFVVVKESNGFRIGRVA